MTNDFYISRFGIWIYIEDREYFIDFSDYPELKNFTVAELSNYCLDKENNIHWENLDIDIELESLANKDKFSLKYKK